LSRKHELRSLSKNQLVDYILKLEERIEQLEAALHKFVNAHTPSSKKFKANSKSSEKNTDKDEQEQREEKKKEDNKPRFPGKPFGSNGGGINIPEPNDWKEHDFSKDEKKQLGLCEPIGKRTQIVIDFPDCPIKTTLHTIFQYIDPKTGKMIEPKTNLSKNIYGKNLEAIVVLLKDLTNSHEKISSLIRELGAPSFSDSQVQIIANKYAKKLEPEREKFLKELLSKQHIHSDETTMREDGMNAYIWGFFTETIAILTAGLSRARKNIETLFPQNIVVVTDGYVAYDFIKNRQRCWAHLIREFKEYASKYTDIEIKTQYLRLKVLYELMKLQISKPIPERDFIKPKWELNDIVTCLTNVNNARGLVTLIKNGGNDWFTALYYEGVPLENNLAERGLRPIVLLRKTIGCYRNNKGKMWIDNVISVLQTWKLRKINLFNELKLYAH